MSKEHHYNTVINWTGNTGQGTKSYTSYEREYDLSVKGKSIIKGSSDPSFRGDPSRYNPEEWFVASLSSCHMLWFLHLCSQDDVIVISYEDHAAGTMIETSDGGGRFKEVVLNPIITVQEEHMLAKMDSIHQAANKLCFIANSVNFPVKHKPTYQVKNK